MAYLGLRAPKILYPFERGVLIIANQFSFPFLPWIYSHQAFAHAAPANSHLPRSPIKSTANSSAQFCFLTFCLIITTFDAVHQSLFLEAFSSLNFQDTTLPISAVPSLSSWLVLSLLPSPYMAQCPRAHFSNRYSLLCTLLCLSQTDSWLYVSSRC